MKRNNSNFFLSGFLAGIVSGGVASYYMLNKNNKNQDQIPSSIKKEMEGKTDEQLFADFLGMETNSSNVDSKLTN